MQNAVFIFSSEPVSYVYYQVSLSRILALLLKIHSILLENLKTFMDFVSINIFSS